MQLYGPPTIGATLQAGGADQLASFQPLLHQERPANNLLMEGLQDIMGNGEEEHDGQPGSSSCFGS